jgi:hypothetical protein
MKFHKSNMKIKNRKYIKTSIKINTVFILMVLKRKPFLLPMPEVKDDLGYKYVILKMKIIMKNNG